MNPTLLVIPVVIALAGFYLYRSYSGMGQKGIAKHYGLAPGETATMMWLGQFAAGPSTAERVATAATGVVVGALFGGIGVATLRARGVTVLITSHDRLVLVAERDDGTAGQAFFASSQEIRVTHLGDGDRRIQGGASARYQFIAAADGIPLEILVHNSAVGVLERWTGRLAR